LKNEEDYLYFLLSKMNDIKLELPYHERISFDKTYLIQYYHSTLSNSFTSDELLILHNKSLELNDYFNLHFNNNNNIDDDDLNF
jgi:hypothetical protein